MKFVCLSSFSILLVGAGFVSANEAACAGDGKMKQVVVEEFNAEDPLSTVKVVEVDIPTPAEGQLLVHMSYMSVNPADFFSLMGLYPGFVPKSLPAVPGLEGMGVVAAVGPRTSIPRDLKGLKVGSRVVPYIADPNAIPKYGGSWAEYVIVPVDNVVLVPKSVEDTSAAQLIINPLTVMGMLDELEAPKGSYILQAAGGSTLGKQFIQIANARGLHVISTVRRCEQVQELRKYGSDKDHIICTVEEDILERVMAITEGQGAYGAVDPVAGNMTAVLETAVRDEGTVLVYGALGGTECSGSVVARVFHKITSKGYWLGHDLQDRSVAERRNFMREAMDYLESRVVVPHTGKVFPIEQVTDAVQDAVRPGRSSEGKTMIKTDPTCATLNAKEEL